MNYKDAGKLTDGVRGMRTMTWGNWETGTVGDRDE